MEENKYRVGIIGFGRIGESLSSSLVHKYADNLSGLTIFYRNEREGEGDKVKAQIAHLEDSIIGKFPMCATSSLGFVGENSDIIVVAIGNKEREREISNRGGLIGLYFEDIKRIMEGIGISESTILMATNHVTSNCLVAQFYSQQLNPNVLGFMGIDYFRGLRILKEWIATENSEINPLELKIDLSLFGPHGTGLIATGASMDFKTAYNDRDLKKMLGFKDPYKTFENLAGQIIERGEALHRQGEGELGVNFSFQIGETIHQIMNDGKDIVAMDISPNKHIKSGFYLKKLKKPIFMGYPVEFTNGLALPSLEIDVKKIPKNLRVSLKDSLIEEREKIKFYLKQTGSQFEKLGDYLNC